MKTCRDRQTRHKIGSFYGGCIYAYRGACEVSCPEVYGLAAVWRSLLKDPPQRDRAGHVRRQGFVVTIDLEALTREEEEPIVCGHHCGWNVYASTQWKATGPMSVSSRNRLLRRNRERRGLVIMLESGVM